MYPNRTRQEVCSCLDFVTSKLDCILFFCIEDMADVLMTYVTSEYAIKE